MNLNTLCPPAMIFVIFCTVQIIFDVLRQVYNTAFFKAVVLVMGTFMLNMLCKQGICKKPIPGADNQPRAGRIALLGSCLPQSFQE